MSDPQLPEYRAGRDAEATLLDLRHRLDAAEVARSPFAETVREPHAHWVSPGMVGQVGFTEWTRDGRPRHPRYVGMRSDKDPRAVVRGS